MKTDIADKWIEALKSGDYTQNIGYMKGYNGFCCLGVLCDLYIKETGEKQWGPTTTEADTTISPHSMYLPPAVQQWAGLRSMSGRYEDKPNASLIFLNDNKRWSFERIADVIETHKEIL